MIVRTTTVNEATPEEIWPLLCQSRIEGGSSRLFRLGLPRPLECRLPSGPGEVGATRQCISDRGTIRQRITTWEPPRLLKFRMEESDLPVGKILTELDEEFRLEELEPGRTRLTRMTRARGTGIAFHILKPALCCGLRTIHRHVFAGWARGRSR